MANLRQALAAGGASLTLSKHSSVADVIGTDEDSVVSEASGPKIEVKILEARKSISVKHGSLVDAVQQLGLGTELGGDCQMALETAIASRTSEILSHSGRLPVELQNDIPALVLAIRRPAEEGGMGIGTHSWLGMTFHNCFKGAELVEWLRPRMAEGLNLRMFCEQLREAGFYRFVVHAAQTVTH